MRPPPPPGHQQPLSPSPGLGGFSSLAVFPTNYFPDLSYSGISIAWSLAAELHFYLMVPLIFVLPRRVVAVFTIVLCGLHILSFYLRFDLADLGFAVGNPTWSWASVWAGYRLPFLIFTIFLMGFLAADQDGDSRPGLLVPWALYVLFFFIFSNPDATKDGAIIVALSIGAVVALPLTMAVLQVRAGAFSGVDLVLGRMAYPLFLGHLACQHVASHFGTMFGWPLVAVVTVAWVSALILAYLTWWLVERNVHAWRYRLRGFGHIQHAGQRAAEPVPSSA